MTKKMSVLLAATSVVLAGAGAQGAAIPHNILQRGSDTLGGSLVSSLGLGIATNGVGGFAVTASTSDGRSHIFGSTSSTPTLGVSAGPGALLRTSGTSGPGYTQIDISGDSVGITSAGNLVYTGALNNGTSNLTAAWYNHLPVAVQGNAVPGFGNLFYGNIINGATASHTGFGFFFSRTSATASGSATGSALLRAGADGTVTALLKSGDSLGGGESVATSTSAIAATQVSADGSRYISRVSLASGGTAMVSSGAILTDAGGNAIRTGQSISAVAGGQGSETWAAFRIPAVTNTGRTLVAGDTTGPTSADEVLMVDGTVALREGASIPIFGTLNSATVAGAIENGADMNEGGDWAAMWDITSGEALISNGMVLVTEGDIVDIDNDGAGDTGWTLASLQTSVSVGERIGGVYEVFFRGRATNGSISTDDILFSVSVPEPASVVGLGLALGSLMLRRRQ